MSFMKKYALAAFALSGLFLLRALLLHSQQLHPSGWGVNDPKQCKVAHFRNETGGTLTIKLLPNCLLIIDNSNFLKYSLDHEI